MWIGSLSGLSKFEGHKTHNYFSSPNDPGALPNDNVRDILTEPSGQVWIGTDSGIGLYRDDTDGFQKFTFGEGHDNRIYKLFRDSTGRFWIGTRSGLAEWLPNGEVIWYRHEWSDFTSIGGGAVRAILEDYTGRIWVGTEQGILNQLIPETDEFERIQIEGCRNIREIVMDRRNTFWIACVVDGLIRYDLATGTYRNIDLGESSEDVRALHIDDQHQIWVGSRTGVFLLDPFGVQLAHFPAENDDPKGLTSGFVLDIFQDETDTMWFAGFSGLSKWNGRALNFAGYSKQLNTNGGLAGNVITNFADDGENVWITTLSGLSRWERASGQFEIISNDILEFDDQRLTAVEYCAGKIWVGSMQSGIRIIDGVDVHTIRHDKDDPYSIPADAIPDITTDREGRCWVATFGGGVAQYLGDGRFRRYPDPINSQGQFSGLHILDVFAATDDRIWLGTQSNGVTVLEPSSGNTLHYRHDVNDSQSLSSDPVISIGESARGVWVGTSDGGVSVLNDDKRSFTRFGKHNGLRSAGVYSMLFEENGDAWIFVDRGIDVIHANDTLTHYDSTDGLMDDDFNQLAAMQLTDGTFVAGGPEGFNAWRPAQISKLAAARSARAHGRARVIQVNKLDQMMSFPAPIEDIDRITLTHEENVIGFEFGLMHYTRGMPSDFEYRLIGFSDAWSIAGDRRSATYTNLAPGDYEFQVRSGGEEGIASKVNLSVLPAPWNTWWAQVLYLLMVFALIWFIYQYLKNRLRLASMNQLELLVAERTQALQDAVAKEELLVRELNHRVKNNMQMITSLITLQLHKLKDQPSRTMLRAIQNRIFTMALVHDSLEGPNGVVGTIQVGQYLKQLVDGLSLDEFRHSGVRAPVIQIEAIDAPLDVVIARSCGLIVNELITNAIKHAFRAEQDDPRILVEFSFSDGEYELSVSDNGIGLSDKTELMSSGSTGFNLISVLVSQQLEGSLCVQHEMGTRVIVSFAAPA